ncbi:hypothetical protein BF49_6844 [Bradyrhizobium sp.]|nr:hypothetical protein BF49_6844 [Bradyrhizobium sp.]
MATICASVAALAQLETACGDTQARLRHMLNTLHRKIA